MTADIPIKPPIDTPRQQFPAALSVTAIVKYLIRFFLQVLGAAVIGTLPVMVYVFALTLASGRSTIGQVITSTLFVGALCLLLIILPACLFVGAPLAEIIHRVSKFTLFRAILLSLALLLPSILFVDYMSYVSGGPDSGPPIGPYSLARFGNSYNSAIDIVLLLGVPLSTALFASISLWYFRYRNEPMQIETQP